VQVSDPRSGRLVARFNAGELSTAAAFSPDGRWLATQSPGGVAQIWPLGARHPRPRAIDQGPGGALALQSAVAFAPDGRSILTATDFGVAVSRLSGRRIGVIRAPTPGLLLSATFSPDGRLILTASEDRLVVWDVQTLRILRIVRTQERVAAASLPAVGPEPPIVAITEDEGVVVWRPRVDRPESLLPGHEGGRLSGALSANGELLVTSDLSSVRIWQLSTGQPVAVLTDLPSPPTAATFDLAGKWVLVADLQGRARLYSCRLCNAPLKRLIVEARRQIHRRLTPDERAKYLHLDG
jgi:WD40 repeat protein